MATSSIINAVFVSDNNFLLWQILTRQRQIKCETYYRANSKQRIKETVNHDRLFLAFECLD